MNKIDLEGRNAIVTGGVRGIGFAIAQRLLASGAACSLWDRDVAALDAAAKALAASPAVHTAAVELTQPDSVKAAADATFKAFGRVDILLNNAGISGANKATWEFTADEWQEVFQVNLFAVFLCCHAIVPKMVEQGYGRIVNIASIAGKEGNPNASHYSASKAGVIGLTKSRDYLFMAEFTLGIFAPKVAARADTYGTAACLSRAVNELVLALFALNRTYIINDKTVLAEIAEFAHAPREFGPRVQKTLAHLGASPAELAAAVESIAQLARETRDLAKEIYEPHYTLPTEDGSLRQRLSETFDGDDAGLL